MKCLFHFGISSMKEGTSAQLSGMGELHGGARVTTLVTLRVYFRQQKSDKNT